MCQQSALSGRRMVQIPHMPVSLCVHVVKPLSLFCSSPHSMQKVLPAALAGVHVFHGFLKKSNKTKAITHRTMPPNISLLLENPIKTLSDKFSQLHL